MSIKPIGQDLAADAPDQFHNVAVLIPSLNEEAAIGQVVSEYKVQLLGAQVYVFDNNSTDNTVEVARAAGANVRTERQRGKGNVVRRMFRDIEADIFLMVDGDLTYDAAAAAHMVELLRKEHLDMVIGARRATQKGAYRYGHRFGNRLLTGLISRLFGAEIKDMLSGYRVLSRRLVKSFPIESAGFEIETELTVHSLQMNAPFLEVETQYAERAEGTVSKLRTYSDGWRVLRTIFTLLTLERPLAVFGGAGLIAILLSVALFVPVLLEFQRTGIVPRVPTLIVSTGFGVIGLVSIFSGMILAGITRTRRDMKRLAFLNAGLSK